MINDYADECTEPKHLSHTPKLFWWQARVRRFGFNMKLHFFDYLRPANDFWEPSLIEFLHSRKFSRKDTIVMWQKCVKHMNKAQRKKERQNVAAPGCAGKRNKTLTQRRKWLAEPLIGDGNIDTCVINFVLSTKVSTFSMQVMYTINDCVAECVLMHNLDIFLIASYSERIIGCIS